MRADLDGKIAFITGSTQGIGKAIALKLAENGEDSDRAAVLAEAPSSRHDRGMTAEGVGPHSEGAQRPRNLASPT